MFKMKISFNLVIVFWILFRYLDWRSISKCFMVLDDVFDREYDPSSRSNSLSTVVSSILNLMFPYVYSIFLHVKMQHVYLLFVYPFNL